MTWIDLLGPFLDHDHVNSVAWFDLCSLQHHLSHVHHDLVHLDLGHLVLCHLVLCLQDLGFEYSEFHSNQVAPRVLDHAVCASSLSFVHGPPMTLQVLPLRELTGPFDSLMAHMMLSKSSVNDLKIFSTTRLAGIDSPFLPSWLATISTQVMYSVTCFLSSIFSASNSPLGA